MEEHWRELQSTDVMNALVMWCLIQAFLSNEAKLQKDSDWEKSDTIGVFAFCGIQTMANLMGGTKRKETMDKLEKFDISTIQDLLSASTGLKSFMFAQLAEATVLELRTQTKETTNFKEFFQSRVRPLFDLQHLVFTVPAMNEFFFEEDLEGVLRVTLEAEGVQSEWKRMGKDVVWQQPGKTADRRRLAY
jgi:hypothetical protein